MRRSVAALFLTLVTSACASPTATNMAMETTPAVPNAKGTATRHAINLATMDAVVEKGSRQTPFPTSTPIPFEDPTVNLPSSYTGPLPPGADMRLGQGPLSILLPSPGGKLLAIGSSASIAIYDAATGNRIWVARTAEGITQLIWSATETQIAAGLQDGSIDVFEAASGKLLHQFPGYGTDITSLAWTPGEKRIIATSRNGVGVLWDMQTGELIKAFVRTDDHVLPYSNASHFNWCQGVLSPDGALFAATYQVGGGDDAQYDDVIVIWDSLTGEQLATLVDENIAHVVWAADSKTLISVSMVGIIDRWDPVSGTLISRGELPESHYYQQSAILLLSSGDRMLLAAHPSGSRVFDMATGQVAYTVDYPESALTWLPDGSALVIYSTEDKTLTLRDAATGASIRAIADVPRPELIAPDGRSFYAAPVVGAPHIIPIERYDMQTGQRQTRYATGSPWVQNLAWSPDGRWIAAASARQIFIAEEPANIVIWDASTGTPVQSLDLPIGLGSELTPVTWSPDSRYLAIGHSGILIWDVGAQQASPKFGKDNVYSLAWSPDGEKLAAGYSGGRATVFDATTREQLYDIQTGSTSSDTFVTALAFTPDSSQLALGDTEGHLITVHTPTGDLLNTYIADDPVRGHHDYVQDVAFSPDGEFLAAVTSDYPDAGILIIWPRGDERPRVRVASPLQSSIYSIGLTSLAWISDGRRIAIGFGAPFEYDFVRVWAPMVSSPVLLWDLDVNRFVSPLIGHTAGVQSVALSPDGTRLASGSLDGTVIIWNVAP